jgi:hypothetical protein
MVGAPLGMANNDGAGAASASSSAERSPVWGARRAFGVGNLEAPTAIFEPSALSAKPGDQRRRRADPAGRLGGHACAATSRIASNSGQEDLEAVHFQLPAISGRMASVMSIIPQMSAL